MYGNIFTDKLTMEILNNKTIASILLIASFALMACAPRNSPHRMDSAKISTHNNQICIGQSEYKENIQKYRNISIGLYERDNPKTAGQLIAQQKFPSSDFKDSNCLSPFPLEIFKSGVEYEIFMAYFEDSNSNWRFKARFCIPDKAKEPLEVFQIHPTSDYNYACPKVNN